MGSDPNEKTSRGQPPFSGPRLALLKGIVLNGLHAAPPIRRRLIARAPDYNARQSVDEMLAAVREKAEWIRDRVPGGVRGRTIVELGPGGEFALEIALIGLGAARTLCIDRDASYLPKHAARVTALYERVAHEYGVQTASASAAPFWHPPLSPGQFEYLVGKGIERENGIPPESVDVIASFAVLEHLRRLDVAFAAMYRLLKPGGWMIHKVDLRDHTNFERPLDFLRYPDWLWRWTLFYENRVRWSEYPPLLAANGFHLAEWWPTHVLPEEQVAALLPRRARRFRRLSDSDLRTLGVGFIARKISPG
jgi:SAM-dependent methyltransferase